tara:strand:- start:124 stop:498 length:375 start_codon:yes stop_codon:yes gene_type:complete
MKNIIITLLICISATASASEVCSIIAGASIIANDGKYLGKVANEYDSDSILNEYGTYGSQYSVDSIWNEYGPYGGEYSVNSPFNEYTSTPPVLVKDGRSIAHLTVNKYLQAPVSPQFIKTCTFY